LRRKNMDIDVKNLTPAILEQEAKRWFAFEPTCLIPLKEAVPEKAFETAFLVLLERHEALAWQFGDLAVEMAQVHGMQAYETLAAKYLSERQARTVEDWAYVCRNVKRKNRRAELTFGHHRKVAPVKNERVQAAWLDRAIKEGWSIRWLGQEIARAGGPTPPPRQEDVAYQIEVENAALHRKIDNLIHEQRVVSERSENVFSIIRQVVGELVALGPEGLARDAGAAIEKLRALLAQLGDQA
jgi:hypothetical protein